MSRHPSSSGARLRLSTTALPPATPRSAVAPDCRLYRGDQPCAHRRPCAGCPHYEPLAHRTCVIKLQPLVEVIQALAILPELRRQHPEGHLTWVSRPEGCRMIAGHPLIDRVLAPDPMTVLLLQQEGFDLGVNLEPQTEPCALLSALFARRKLGFGLSRHGTPAPLNPQAEPFCPPGLAEADAGSPTARLHQMLGLTWRGDRYSLVAADADRDRMRLHLAARGWQPGRPTVALGVSDAMAALPGPALGELARRLNDARPAQWLLLGSAAERFASERLRESLLRGSPRANVVEAAADYDEAAWRALLDTPDVVVAGPGLALHTAIALGKRVVLWGDGADGGIDLFGRGVKLATSSHELLDQTVAAIQEAWAGAPAAHARWRQAG